MRDLMLYTEQATILPAGTDDESLIDLWLSGRPRSTQDAYELDIKQFRSFAPVPLQELKLPHVQYYVNDLSLKGLAPTTIKRRVMAVKSLLTFAHETGYTRFNVGKMVKIPKSRNRLAQRILSHEQVIRIVALETDKRDHALLRLFYSSGIRVSELCDLTWKDVQPRPEEHTGQISVYGKGAKERTIILKSGVYEELRSLRGDAPSNAPVFPGRGRGRGAKEEGSKLTRSQVFRIVKEASLRAGVEVDLVKKQDGEVQQSRVSPHWLRHAHASHALEKGASIELVRETLGHESIEITAGYTHARPNTSSSQFIDV